jgi:tetratricopeptide (TPR) repeat protein
MLRKIVYTLFFLFIAAFFSFANSDTREIDLDSPQFSSNEWYLQGKFYYLNRDYVKAYDALKMAVKVWPENEKAKKLLDKIIKIANFEKIKLEKNIEKTEETIRKEKLKLQEKKVEKVKRTTAFDEFHFKLGKKYYEAKKLNLAKEEFLKTLKIYPQNVIAHYYLYKIARSEKNYDDVIEEINFIRKFLAPYDLWNKYKKAGNIKEIEEKIRELEPYFKYFPDEDFSKKFKKDVKCYLNTLILEEAYFEYSKLLNFKEFFGDYFPYKIIPELNDYNEINYDFSIATLEKTGFLNQKYSCPLGGKYVFENGRVYCTRCDVLEKENKTLSASSSKKSKKDMFEFLRYKKEGDDFLTLGKYSQALISYNQALKYGESADIYNKIGVIYKLKGKIDDAEKMFRKAINMKFDFVSAYNNLATVYYSKKLYEKSVSLLKKALLIKDTDYNLHYNIALAYEKLGKDDEALKHFYIATLLNGAEPDPYVHMAIIYKNKGDFDNAIRMLYKAKSIIKNNPDLTITIENLIENLIKDKNTRKK